MRHPDIYLDVADFHHKFRPHHIQPRPCVPKPEMAILIHELIKEEALQELLPALEELITLSEQAAGGAILNQATVLEVLARVADGSADLIYVIMGAVQACGIRFNPVWEAVQAANMAKEGGDTRPDGKILKPEGWQAPDVIGVLRRQLHAPVQEETSVEDFGGPGAWGGGPL